jgi:hypothetical protein
MSLPALSPHTRARTHTHKHTHTHNRQLRGLFKMDTIGDAYVVAGFVSAASTPGRHPRPSTPAGRGGDATPALLPTRPSSASAANLSRPSVAMVSLSRSSSVGGAQWLSLGATGAAAEEAAAELAAAVAAAGGAEAMRGVCEDVLYVAGAMIAAIAEYRESSGRDAHCRCVYASDREREVGGGGGGRRGRKGLLLS